MKPIKIGTITAELMACRAAFAAYPKSTLAWCCHHKNHCEPLTESFENRIKFILSSKQENELAIRFRNFRPCKDSKAWVQARKGYNEAVVQASKAYNEAVAQASKAYDEAVAPARKAYNEAVAPARKAYNEAVAQASKAYNEAVAPARKAYNEAVAQASKACNEAVAQASKAYNEALDQAGKAYNEALAQASKPLRAMHKKEWPNNTWTGKSIFKKIAYENPLHLGPEL